jgi:signal transduction histidine kinase
MQRFATHLLDLAGLFTIAVVGLISFISIDDPQSRWIALGLILAFAALDVIFGGGSKLRRGWVYFAAQTALVGGLFLLGPDQFAAPILFFVLSAEAMVALTLRQAALWLGIFILVTAINAFAIGGPIGGFFFTLPYVAGYSFFAAFGKAMRDAQEARLESQRLLEELRAAQEQLKELAIAEERNRLARELHDSLGHRLTVAVVQLEGAQRLIEKDPERAGRMIGVMREQMKEALADLRRSVATLRAPLADDVPFGEPLDAALTRLARSFHENTGLAVHLSLPTHLPPLTEAQRLALYRAAQESLTNTHKHAGARNIWLNLSVADAQLTLTAADDGRGLPANPNGGGFGLRGLRERAALLGGSLELGARPGGGAQVSFIVPLNRT